jgi:TRAP-type mannitol/chloroaromatic compound transport system permease small subunit
MGILTRYLVLQDGLSEFVGRAISWLTLAMIAVLMFEIVARYFLNSPTIWAHETSTMLYGAFCILAGSYTLRHQGHVRSEVIWGALPPRVKAALDVVTFGLTFAVLTVFLKLAIDFAAVSWGGARILQQIDLAAPTLPDQNCDPALGWAVDATGSGRVHPFRPDHMWLVLHRSTCRRA